MYYYDNGLIGLAILRWPIEPIECHVVYIDMCRLMHWISYDHVQVKCPYVVYMYYYVLIGVLRSVSKLRSIHATIHQLLRFQLQTHYVPLKDAKEAERLRTYTKQISHYSPLEERHLYRLSCMCEPPAWKKRTAFKTLSGAADLAGL